MKSNQKNRNRNQQPRQNQQHQPCIPKSIMKQLSVLGADISISQGVTIPVPRDEYDELLYCAALVDILRRMYESGNKYAMGDLLEKIFMEPNNEKEGK